MAATVTLIPGDGIGPEIVDGAVRIFEAAGADVEWDRQLAGMAAVHGGLGPLPDETTDSILANKIALKGPLTTPVGEGFRSINVALRKHFDLYANVRPALSLIPGGRYDDLDLVVIRENTEGLYVGVEHFIGVEEDPQAAAESVMIVTRYGAERIARFAFDYALANGRKKVTLVHKANILKCTQGLFLDVGRAIAEEYAGRIEFEDRIVDNTAMQLVVNPYQFDVLVMENMFGDILSDQASGLIGGLGLAPGANIGNHAAIFEAVHGSAPDIAGQGVANPSAVVLAGCMMFEYLGMREVAGRVREALVAALRSDVRTRDLGGVASTREFVDRVIKEMAA
jgi:isocitrate dehydrogenase (NAD+)